MQFEEMINWLTTEYLMTIIITNNTGQLSSLLRITSLNFTVYVQFRKLWMKVSHFISFNTVCVIEKLQKTRIYLRHSAHVETWYYTTENICITPYIALYYGVCIGQCFYFIDNTRYEMRQQSSFVRSIKCIQ